MIDRKARIADRAQHRIAQFGAVIELIAIGGLEQQPAEADRLHQEAIGHSPLLERLSGDSVPTRRVAKSITRRPRHRNSNQQSINNRKIT